MHGEETLNAREQEILHSIVRSYIQTGEPVSSRTIARRRHQALSQNLWLDFCAADPLTGVTICVTLACGETNLTVDAGLYRPSAIGDFVWDDRNRNGLQDASEPGISNSLVRLLDCLGNEVARTNTDANGGYLFTGLVPGSYVVQFVATNGFTFTTPNVGSDDAIDSDANPGDGKSPCTTLISGETNRTVDAGLFRTTAIGDFMDAHKRPGKIAVMFESETPVVECAGRCSREKRLRRRISSGVIPSSRPTASKIASRTQVSTAHGPRYEM
jgi:hypothetical protein